MNIALERAWRWPATAFYRPLPAWVIGYLSLVAVGLVARPLLPVDETRYLGVAWEMWAQQQWLVPQLNGEPYAHKPPLLFWLIHLGWIVGGVGELWPRLLGPTLALLCGWQLAQLASVLWPAQSNARRLAPLLFLGSGYVALQSTALSFDLLLLLGMLGAWTALWRAAQGKRWAWPLYGASLGMALLAKGPVALIYVLPVWLLAPTWRGRDDWAWYAYGMLALAFAAALPLAWVYAVAQQQPAEFVGELLFDQALQRITGSIGHGRPWWWYLPLLPALTLPWLAWPALWRALRISADVRADGGWRFALCIVASGLVLLTLIGGKQIHYLLPVLAGAALLATRALSGQRAATATALRWAVLAWSAIAVLLLAFGLILRPAYDLREFSRQLGEAQRQGRPLALVAGKYQGEFGYFGRLQIPLTVLRAAQVSAWRREHPQGLIVVRDKRASFCQPMAPLFAQPYKTDRLLALSVAQARNVCFADGSGRHCGESCEAANPNAALPDQGPLP